MGPKSVMRMCIRGFRVSGWGGVVGFRDLALNPKPSLRLQKRSLVVSPLLVDDSVAVQDPNIEPSTFRVFGLGFPYDHEPERRYPNFLKFPIYRS